MRSKAYSHIYLALAFVHAFLLIWGIVGLLEFVLPSVPWAPVTNPNFPPGVLLMHWIAIMAGGTAFFWGRYISKTLFSKLMIPAYAFMALVCAIETFAFMTSQTKYIAMALEYITYIALSIFYLKSPPSHNDSEGYESSHNF